MKKKALTPITDFLTEYANSGIARFHMPGHKGNFAQRNRNAGMSSAYDITEIHGADSLYFADGIIKDSEAVARELFGTYATVFSAGGSTLCIQAMLLCSLSPGATVVCGRNAHIAFHNAAALFDFIPHWVYPESASSDGVGGIITARQVRKALCDAEKAGKKAEAVYITSPDYLGVMSDVGSIAEVCSEFSVPLLVDNAHGAHLKFTSENRHPISLGAAMCCDSAHKTLPALTGAAYLHSGGVYNERDLKEAMALVGSTSPSYLTLNSLDRCNEYLANCAQKDFAMLEAHKGGLVRIAEQAGFEATPGTDCTKLTLDCCSAGYEAAAAADYFRRNKIECEYAGGENIVFLLTPFNTRTEFQRLADALYMFEKREKIASEPFDYEVSESKMTPHEAFSADKETVELSQAVGRSAAQAPVLCPPGVPVVSFGEIVTEKTARILKNSGKTTLKVVK